MKQAMAMDQEQVKAILPHREPMLFIHSVTNCVPMEQIEAQLYLDPSWKIFEGHFPGAPVFPGVLSVECMAQAADLMLMTAEQYQGKTPLFAGIEKARFLKKLSPGDRVTARVSVQEEKKEKAVIICQATLSVGEELAATAIVTLAMR